MDTKNDQQQYIDTIQQLEKKLADCKNDKSELINKYTIRLLELCPFHSQSLPANRMTTVSFNVTNIYYIHQLIINSIFRISQEV